MFFTDDVKGDYERSSPRRRVHHAAHDGRRHCDAERHLRNLIQLTQLHAIHLPSYPNP